MARLVGWAHAGASAEPAADVVESRWAGLWRLRRRRTHRRCAQAGQPLGGLLGRGHRMAGAKSARARAAVPRARGALPRQPTARRRAARDGMARTRRLPLLLAALELARRAGRHLVEDLHALTHSTFGS